MELFLFCLPILVSLILSFKMLFKTKTQSLSNRILGIFFLIFCFILFTILLQFIRSYYPFVNNYFFIVEILFYSVMLSLPVIVYFYIVSLTDNIKFYKKFVNVLPHFFLPLQSLLFNLYFLTFYDNVKNNLVSYSLEQTNFFSLKIIFVLLNFYYISLAIKIYKKHRNNIKDVLSYDVGISLNWILVFIFGYLFFVICFFVLNPNSAPYVVYLPLLLLVIFYVFQQNTQKLISVENDISNNEIIFETKVNPTFNLNDSKKELIKNELLKLLEEEKIYLKKELTIFDIAKKLKTNNTYISNIINTTFESNFVTFINSYRIEDAKIKLLSTEYSNYTIEAIAEIVGFNSKSTFNSAFKNKVGITPSEFKKKNKE